MSAWTQMGTMLWERLHVCMTSSYLFTNDTLHTVQSVSVAIHNHPTTLLLKNWHLWKRFNKSSLSTWESVGHTCPRNSTCKVLRLSGL